MELFAYLRLGITHILNIGAYDHLLFIAALVAGETARLKRLLILVTAFTVGHSLTLALAAFDVVHFDGRWVEFFVACTILVTSVLNLLRFEQKEMLKYGIALVFGLVHGLAFSQTIAGMLMGDSIIPALAGFNIGVEIAQLIVVTAIVAVARMIPQTRMMRYLPSMLTATIALVIMATRIP